MSDLQKEVDTLEYYKIMAQKANERVKEQKRYIAREFSPVAAGDEVEVNGISHAGKRMHVTEVQFLGCASRGGKVFKAKGFVLKADGDAGRQTAESLYYEDGSQGPKVFV